MLKLGNIAKKVNISKFFLLWLGNVKQIYQQRKININLLYKSYSAILQIYLIDLPGNVEKTIVNNFT